MALRLKLRVWLRIVSNSIPVEKLPGEETFCQTAPMKMLPLLCVLVWACGCSPKNARLADQIRGADRIVATNRSVSAPVVVEGSEAKRIAAAAAGAKWDRNYYPAIFDWDVQFYAGTNFLAVIRLQDRIFKTKHAQFNDETGVLKAFYYGQLTPTQEQSTHERMQAR